MFSFSLRSLPAFFGRVLVVVFGLFICATGIVLTYRSVLGLGPWDVLHQGLSFHSPLTFGQASITVGAVLIVASLLLKVYPGLGTVLNMSLIGIFVDWQLRMNWLPDLSSLPYVVRIPIDALGVFMMGLGTAFYIAPRLGAGPRDGLMLRLHVLTRARIAIVRAVLECSALGLGFLLGGTVGLGTLIFAFGVGPSVEVSIWLVNKLRVMLGLPPTEHIKTTPVPVAVEETVTPSST